MKRYVTRRQRQEISARRNKRICLALFAVIIVFVSMFIFIIRKTYYKKVKKSNSGSLSQVDADPGSIPDFTGEEYIILNDGRPNFNEWDLNNIRGEHYSELDSFGRCGSAYAMLEKSMMPDTPRGEIGYIKPTGWVQKKYVGIVNSTPPYLYNRCHLIAYALTGQNDNVKNLITGTRYMNSDLMLRWEEKVMKCLDEGTVSVLYRVSPYFQGSELLARGVEMEAYSVEDQGDTICFHVFVYNIQPGIVIDYATGKSRIK